MTEIKKRNNRRNNGKKKFEWGQSQTMPDNLQVNRNGIPVHGQREEKVRRYPGQDKQ